MTINIKLARSWNELSEKQLKEICYAYEVLKKLLKSHPKREHPLLYSKFYIQMIKNLLRSNNFIKTWIALRQIPPEEYREHVKFLLDDVARTKFLPAFKIKGTRYHPPLPQLQNVNMKEFSFVDSLYYNWKQTGRESYLDLLCAALYRPEGGNELDVRKPFNKILVRQAVPAFASLDKKKKLAIAYTYEGCRNYIVKLHPTVFPPVQQGEKKMNKPTYTPFGKLLMHKIQFDTSKFDLTQNLNIYEFLGIFENELQELQRQKK